MYRLYFRVLAFALCCQVAMANESTRYWYSADCSQRFAADFDYATEHVLLVIDSPGKLKAIPLQQMSRSDRTFAEAFRLAKEGATYLESSPWLPELERFRLEDLLLNYDIDPDRSVYDVSATELHRYRIPQLTGRWIEFNGVEYKVVASHRSVEHTGYDRLEVQDPIFGVVSLDPAQLSSLRLLPEYWARRVYQPRLNSTAGGIFRQRGPVGYHLGDQPELYDVVFRDGVWTSDAIARANQKIDESVANFQRWETDRLLTEACWNFHQGNLIADSVFSAGWTNTFPWHTGPIPNSNKLITAQNHFDQATRLAPQWSEPLLRSAAIDESLGRYSSAAAKLRHFQTLKPTAIDLPIPVRSHASLQYAESILQARLLVVWEENWRRSDLAIENDVERAVAAILKPSSPAASAEELRPRLMKNLLGKATHHFLERRDFHFAQNDPLAAITATVIASRYSTHTNAKDAQQEDLIAFNVSDASQAEEINTSIGSSDYQLVRHNYRLAWIEAEDALKEARSKQKSNAELITKADNQLKKSLAHDFLFNINFGL